MKQFGNPPLSKSTPPLPLSTNPLISEQFFYDPSLFPNFKNKNPLPPPPPPNFRGDETMSKDTVWQENKFKFSGKTIGN